ncbi:MAG TPA: YfaZ family outer membrane protein [Woeseiaceae bacterium]
MAHPYFPLAALLAGAVLVNVPHAASAQVRDAAGEISLSDESAQLQYLTWGSGQSTELGFGLFLNENRDIIATSHYYIEAEAIGSSRLTFKAGPVAYAAMLNTENTDVFAIAVGAEIRYELLRRPSISLAVQGAYAPDILTFGSADNLYDFTGRAELPLTDNVIGFAGYRKLEFDLLTGSREVEESAIVGIRYLF